MKKREPRVAGRIDIAVIIALSCAMTALFMLIRPLFDEGGDLYAGMLSLLIYLFSLFLWAGLRMRRHASGSSDTVKDIFDSFLGTALEDMHHPVLLTDEAGRTVFCNGEMLTLLEREDIAAGTPVDHLCEIEVQKDTTYAICGERRCLLYRTPLTVEDRTYTLLNFYDVTERLSLERRYREERAVVAYAIVDNIEEILQFVQDNYAETATRVEEKLAEWMSSVGGLIRSYDRNKYLLVFDNVHLEACLKDQFAVLDDIRAIRVGDGMPLTISLGVSYLENATLAEGEEAAQYALDLALQRGGDQVVVRDKVGVSFFGGRTKASYKRVNIRARVVAAQLMSLVGRAGNVIVLGHNFGDYDSFASCVGLARLVENLGVRVNIAVKRDQGNLRECFARVAGLPEYNGMFVDEAEALDLLAADTLVILSDVNNYQYAECPELLARATTVAIIDHHIKTAEFNSAVKLEYIDPTASSASELVSEIIESSVGARVLRPEEAELLLSGVLLDTKRFTRNTGTRTFAVAQFLRGAGANPGDTFEFFKSTPEELAKEAKFNSHVVMYRSSVAIAACEEDEEIDASYRTIAAKVADGLLGVKGVNMSFALVKVEDTVYISARSDGTVNVQVILEMLHGGGHFDVAGAQMKKVTVETAVERLRAAIDEYFDNKNKGETI